jgi:hypothetical protein
MNKPILITGCPRSGSSVIASAINVCGAFGGEMSKRGMNSNDSIREELVKPYLNFIGVDEYGQFPLPSISEMVFSSNSWKGNVEKILKSQGYKEGQWMYKDSRSCLIWPVWDHAFPDAKWIIVRRKTSDIVQSCMKTAYMDAFGSKVNQMAVGVNSERDGWIWWVREYEKRFLEIVEAKLNYKIIWPERMNDRDYGQMHELLDWLELPWNDKVVDLIYSLLWKSK